MSVSNKDRIFSTANYFRGQLKDYAKDEIIEAMLLKLDYVQVESVVNGCWQIRNMKKMEADVRREEREAKVLKESIEEYNKLVKESKEIGFENMPSVKINRMATLIKIIRNGGRK